LRQGVYEIFPTLSIAFAQIRECARAKSTTTDIAPRFTEISDRKKLATPDKVFVIDRWSIGEGDLAQGHRAGSCFTKDDGRRWSFTTDRVATWRQPGRRVRPGRFKRSDNGCRLGQFYRRRQGGTPPEQQAFSENRPDERRGDNDLCAHCNPLPDRWQ